MAAGGREFTKYAVHISQGTATLVWPHHEFSLMSMPAHIWRSNYQPPLLAGLQQGIAL